MGGHRPAVESALETGLRCPNRDHAMVTQTPPGRDLPVTTAMVSPGRRRPDLTVTTAFSPHFHAQPMVSAANRRHLNLVATLYLPFSPSSLYFFIVFISGAHSTSAGAQGTSGGAHSTTPQQTLVDMWTTLSPHHVATGHRQIGPPRRSPCHHRIHPQHRRRRLPCRTSAQPY